jgi:hypothetical protein
MTAATWTSSSSGSTVAATRWKFLKKIRSHDQGCQMVYFQTKNRHLGQFWRVFQ